MPPKILPPDLRPLLQRLDSRVGVLERRVAPELTFPDDLDGVPFTVVAADGSGDYRSIGEAIEASGGLTLIYVKAGTYTDTGAVTLSDGQRIVVAAANTLPGYEKDSRQVYTQTSAGKQTWTMAGITGPASGHAEIVLLGLSLTQTGGAAAIAPGAGTTLFRASNCAIGQLYPAAYNAGPQQVQVELYGCTVSPVFVSSTNTPEIQADQCHLQMVASNTGVTVDDYCGVVLTNCRLQFTGGSLTFNTSGDNDSFQYQAFVSGCLLVDEGGLSGATWTFGGATRVQFIDCSDTLRQDKPGTPDFVFNARSFTSNHYILANCFFPQSTITVGAPPNDFSGSELYVANLRATALTAASSSGRAAFLAGTLILGGNLTVGCDNGAITGYVGGDVTYDAASSNNYFFGRIVGATIDNGSGNIINALPPTGSAGGVLSGTYPAPSLSSSAFGSPGTSDFGDAAADGTNPTAARSDHTHGREAGVEIKKAGGSVGTRPAINLIEGSNVTLTVADDSGNGEVDVTIAATGGGSADETLIWMQVSP